MWNTAFAHPNLGYKQKQTPVVWSKWFVCRLRTESSLDEILWKQLTRRFNSLFDKDDFAALSNSQDLNSPPPNATKHWLFLSLTALLGTYDIDVDLAWSHTFRTEGWDPRTLTALWSWTFAQEGFLIRWWLLMTCVCASSFKFLYFLDFSLIHWQVWKQC